MMTFLTLVFILIFINITMILTSLYNTNKSKSTSNKSLGDSSVSKIYPLDISTSDYKKAV
ncbi:hypothetical protein LX92_01156 [Maribacter polysiphoniae]|uniref:Uncharacterized protein n=1 Tax=Maribacter polysiphoniae TaxID=429344 RepID=A0A316E318_9FLAO|nr:hypothetical protein LX92_01156 [Maribacter polysiphoniae]